MPNRPIFPRHAMGPGGPMLSRGLLATLALAGTAAVATPPQAEWSSPPPDGSYTLTCKDIAYDGPSKRLRAVCKGKSGDYLFLNKTGKVYDNTNANILDTRYCLEYSIYNDNGRLRCAIDLAKKSADDAQQAQALAKYQAAKEFDAANAAAASAWSSASAVVFGRAPRADERRQWSAFAASQPQLADKLKASLKFADAVSALKMLMADPHWAIWQTAMIDNAFLEVWGRPSTPVEQAQYAAEINQQKTWYTPIVLKEVGRVKSTAGGADAVVQQMSMDCIGRPAVAAELATWKAKGQHYRPLRENCRQWLHSGEGAAELAATVRRALSAQQPTPPSDAQVKTALTAYSARKAIFVEMFAK